MNFGNPTGKTKLSSTDCSTVIECFMESNAAFMLGEDEFVDDEMNGDNNDDINEVSGLSKRLINEVNS